ncbi:type IV fimbrial biogenesis protein FimT [Desulfonatronum zhilinae]|nr:type IV fimbrial biogenesis protein FimT [Desulfonatronum zhilinae]
MKSKSSEMDCRMSNKDAITQNTRAGRVVRRNAVGLTIIEVLVVVAIISIMAIVGLPSLQDFIRRARISSQAHEFVGTLNYARSEAIKRGQRVTVCKSADGELCATTGNWDQGWIVFVDANNDNIRQTGEELLRVRSPLDEGISLAGNTNVATYVSFLNNGGATQIGTITLCVHGRGIDFLLIRSGRVRTEAITCS